MSEQTLKVKIAVHKFSSCDGCQLAFINSIDNILKLIDFIDIVHFAEAGPYNPDTHVDIAFIEGSIATQKDIERIEDIRQKSKLLVSIGACATTGGIQALRNISQHEIWREAIYANPEFINDLIKTTPIANHVHVDHELWGCPVDNQQLLNSIQTWLLNTKPEIQHDSVCTECKQKQNSCIMITKNKACMGPVTRAGCSAICPSHHRGCYGCYGPAHFNNSDSLAQQFKIMGITNHNIADQFLGINNHAKTFLNTGLKFKPDHE